jgi:hypothetical protein
LRNTRSGAGFSWGLMLRIKALEINYGRAIYHITGGVNILTLTLDAQRIYDKQLKKRKSKSAKADTTL